jgi:hypothetical protein
MISANLKTAVLWMPIAVTLAVPAGAVLAAENGGRNPATVAAEIDREVDRRLAEARVPASPPADDAEFLRRAALDITGRIPTLERTVAFLDSRDTDKRRKFIDELLASADYGRHFATLWRNRLAPASSAKGKYQIDRFSPWLAEQFNRNRGWDRVVHDLLTMEGEIARNPQSAFLMANSENSRPQANQLAGAAARFFLGVQLRCAECHDHPFAPWKQADFWGTAAFFGRLRNDGKKGAPMGLTEEIDRDSKPSGKDGTPVIATAPGGGIVIPASAGKSSGKVIKARFLGGDEPTLAGEGPLRTVLAAWITSPDNRLFAPALVNRTWVHLFGSGFVNPVDDLRDDNPASHPALLKRLADEFRASGHDCKHLIRCICNSRAYQRTSRPLEGNESDRELFSHMAVKALSPEAFYDSLTVVGAAGKLAPAPAGKEGGKEKGPPQQSRDEFVQFFRSQGETADENAFSHGIPQFLKRLNGESLNQRPPLIDRLVRSGADPKQAVESLYLATLARRPTPDEVELMSTYLARRADPAQGYAGVLWILLNSGEFILNH